MLEKRSSGSNTKYNSSLRGTTSRGPGKTKNNFSVSMVSTRSGTESKTREDAREKQVEPTIEIDLETPDQSVDEVEKKTTESTPMPHMEDQNLKTVEFSPIDALEYTTGNTRETVKNYSQVKKTSFTEKLAMMVGMKSKDNTAEESQTGRARTFGTVSTKATEADPKEEQARKEATAGNKTTADHETATLELGDLMTKLNQIDKRLKYSEEDRDLIKKELKYNKHEYLDSYFNLAKATDERLQQMSNKVDATNEERDKNIKKDMQQLKNRYDDVNSQLGSLEKRMDIMNRNQAESSCAIQAKLDAILRNSTSQERPAADRTQGTRVDFVEPQRGKRQSTPLPLTRDTVSIAPTAAKTIMKKGTSSTTTGSGDSTASSNAGPDAMTWASTWEMMNRTLEAFATRNTDSSDRRDGKSRKTFKKPKEFKDDSDGCIDTWVEVMRLHLEQDNLNDERQACTAILSNLEGTALKCVVAKKEEERDTADKIFEILLNRFGSGMKGHQAMMRFEKRRQRDDESIDRFLDDLESLRRRSDPEESTNRRNFSIASKFIDGVKTEAIAKVKQDLAAKEIEQRLKLEIEKQNFNEALTGSNPTPEAVPGSTKTGNCNTVKMVTGKPFGISKIGARIMSIITVGGHEVTRNLSEPSDQTKMHIDVYADYLSYISPQTTSRALRALLMRGGSKSVRVDNRYTEAYGPHEVMLNIDGINIYTNTKITCDEDLIGQIYVGKEELKVRSIGHCAMLEEDAMHIGTEADVTGHVLDISGKKTQLRGLLDTGAVLSVIPIETWEKMGFDKGDLIDSRIRLSAANKGALRVLGRTPIIALNLGERNLWMSFLVVENLDESDQFILGRDFIRKFDVTIDLNNAMFRIRNPDRRYAIKPVNLIMANENKAPVFLSRRVRLKANEAAIVSLRMKNYNELSDNKQVCIVPNPNSQSAAVLGRSFSITKSGLCVSVLLNTLDIPITIQRGRKLGYALPVKTRYETIENSKQNEVVDCPNHRDKICILRRLQKIKDSSGLIKSLKSETDDGLSSCSNFPERPTLDEMQTDKPVLPEIEHLRGKLKDEQLEAIKDVLERNEEVFSRHKADIGCCNFVEHEIELEENAVPHREGARRMTPHKSDACRKKIETLLEYDMIEPSKSPWACGVVMAKKKGDQLRFCCDFRYLNSVTVKDAYPIPRIDESLSKLGDAKFFTTLDLGSAFWQVPLRKQDRDKTGFACEFGLFQWKRMPFGLCNATATFQRLMAHALIGVTKKYGNLVMCYVDDVVIATPTLEDHIERLDEVFACMKRSGPKCKPSKCEILKDSIKYLGRMVDKHGIRPDTDAVEAVLTWKSPKTEHQLMSFLGFANYYREFIKGYADKVYPMQQLMRHKGKKFTWNNAAEESFQRIKKELCEAPVLGMLTEKGMYVLDTDASVVAISGTLHQEQEWNGKTVLRPIAYGSKVLSDTEMKYGAPKAEMFAVVTFVEKYRAYLGSEPFRLRVDNRALSWLKNVLNGPKLHWEVDSSPRRIQHDN